MGSGEYFLIKKVSSIPWNLAYQSKIYPFCKCGRKYVPLKNRDKSKCFWCLAEGTDEGKKKISKQSVSEHFPKILVKCPQCSLKHYIRSFWKSTTCSPCRYQSRKITLNKYAIPKKYSKCNQ